MPATASALTAVKALARYKLHAKSGKKLSTIQPKTKKNFLILDKLGCASELLK